MNDRARGARPARVEAVIAAARSGESGALPISGEPGIGKTLLLEHAREAAAAEGALVLEASAPRASRTSPSPAWPTCCDRPSDTSAPCRTPRPAALRGALRLGPPVPGDRFTAYVAALGVLAAAAEERPVVCIVNDAHWLDAESLEALLFVSAPPRGRRHRDPHGEPGGDQRPDRGEHGLNRLRLGGLAPGDASTLLRRSTPHKVARGVLASLVEGAAGNPLALIELAGALSAAQLAADAPLPDPLPVGPYLERALLRPLEALPPSTRRALLVASAADHDEALTAALAAEGLAAADLAPAEAAGVITGEPDAVVFSHPLVRSAVYQSADAPDRRAVHRALAGGTAGARPGSRRPGPPGVAPRPRERGARRRRRHRAGAGGAPGRGPGRPRRGQRGVRGRRRASAPSPPTAGAAPAQRARALWRAATSHAQGGSSTTSWRTPRTPRRRSRPWSGAATSRRLPGPRAARSTCWSRPPTGPRRWPRRQPPGCSSRRPSPP